MLILFPLLQGNCKFGPKCANIHVLPDGRRINYGKNGVTIGPAGPINLGSRVNPSTYHQSSNSALTSSFMRADGSAVPAYGATSPYGDDRYHQQLGRRPSMENGLPTIDAPYSGPGSAYGSPGREDEPSRFGLGLSPGNAKGLSVLDAPLPASFDSNGISHAARYGPWPSSVPSKFGLDSPSPSLNMAKESRTSEALKLLHNSAFGSSDRASPSHISGASAPGGAPDSSPPTSSLQLGGADEYFGKRAMHSSAHRYAKPRMLSSSAPKIDRDWEAEFMFFEEDYVPGNLANEVLTPAEKARRGSLRQADGELPPLTAEGGNLSTTPSTSVTKYGSPIGSSPSRWGPLFQRQREEEVEGAGSSSSSNNMGKSMKHAASAFGHVGSPLRNSSLASQLGEELRGPGSRQGSGSESLSALTQQLQRSRLGEDNSVGGSAGASPRLHPNSARTTSSGSGGAIGITGRERDRESQRGLERHVSSGSVGSSVMGRFTTPIDEEDPAFVFSMEEDQDDAHMKARKRISGGGGLGWGYASGAAGRTANGAASSGQSSAPDAVAESVSGR